MTVGRDAKRLAHPDARRDAVRLVPGGKGALDDLPRRGHPRSDVRVELDALAVAGDADDVLDRQRASREDDRHPSIIAHARATATSAATTKAPAAISTIVPPGGRSP